MHGVGIAPLSVSVAASSNDTGSCEPSPRSSNLTTIAVEGEALGTVAAASGVGYREEVGEGSASGDASPVVESLGSSMGPA